MLEVQNSCFLYQLPMLEVQNSCFLINPYAGGASLHWWLVLRPPTSPP